jgi:hypothetical protein
MASSWPSPRRTTRLTSSTCRDEWDQSCENASTLDATFTWKLLGWTPTTGAPIWFDMLSKLVPVRSTGRRPKGQAKPEAPKS